jgi:hypothetical protein
LGAAAALLCAVLVQQVATCHVRYGFSLFGGALTAYLCTALKVVLAVLQPQWAVVFATLPLQLDEHAGICPCTPEVTLVNLRGDSTDQHQGFKWCFQVAAATKHLN